MNRILRTSAVAGLLLVASLGTAAAHAHLKAAAPAAGGTVAKAPTELRLDFSEGVDPAFTGVALTGPSGAPVATGTPALAPGGARTLVVPVTGTLSPGRYRIDWHALATDGHKTNGSYTFTVGR